MQGRQYLNSGETPNEAVIVLYDKVPVGRKNEDQTIP